MDEPYIADRQELTKVLREAALLCNDITLWRFTEAGTHTDEQSPYGSWKMCYVLLGGLGRWYTSRYGDEMPPGVNWLEGGGSQLARLVEVSGNDNFKVSMYSFDEFDREVIIRLLRLDAGCYRIQLHLDRDGDGSYESVASQRDEHLSRFAKISVAVPPKVPVLLEISQLQADPDLGDWPDLAISNYYVRKRGDSLVVTIHNIGSAKTGPFSVSLLNPEGQMVTTKQLASLAAATDFVPKTVDVTFDNISDCTGYRIHIDPQDLIKEIFEENNTVTISQEEYGVFNVSDFEHSQ